MQRMITIFLLIYSVFIHAQAGEIKAHSPVHIISLPNVPGIPDSNIPEGPTTNETNPDISLIIAATGGIWFNPHNDGEGFFIHIDDGLRFTVTWYTFDEQGQQLWLIGTQSYLFGDNSVTVALSRPKGTQFGSQFNGADINKTAWGNMTFTFNSCNTGVAVFQSNLDGVFGSGTIPITKLSNHAQSVCPIPPTAVEAPSYSQDDDPVQDFGVGLFASTGDHTIDGVMIVSERLLIKDGQCHLQVTLKNFTGVKTATAVVSYDFFSGSVNVASAGVSARFTDIGQTITTVNPIVIVHPDFIGITSCAIYDQISLGGFQVPLR